MGTCDSFNKHHHISKIENFIKENINFCVELEEEKINDKLVTISQNENILLEHISNTYLYLLYWFYWFYWFIDTIIYM